MAEQVWTASLVDERLCEAAEVLRRLPNTRIQGYVSTWPPMVREYWESYGRSEVRVRLGPPSPASIDRMDRALEWLRWLDADNAKLVWARANGTPWKGICWTFGVSRATAHRHWQYGIGIIVWRLNGRRPPAKRSRRFVVEQLARLSSSL